MTAWWSGYFTAGWGRKYRLFWWYKELITFSLCDTLCDKVNSIESFWENPPYLTGLLLLRHLLQKFIANYSNVRACRLHTWGLRMASPSSAYLIRMMWTSSWGFSMILRLRKPWQTIKLLVALSCSCWMNLSARNRAGSAVQKSREASWFDTQALVREALLYSYPLSGMCWKEG